jgi:hypothetical protein
MVTSYTQIMSRWIRRTVDEDCRQFMDQIVGGIRHPTQHLIRNLLVFTHLDCGSR